MSIESWAEEFFSPVEEGISDLEALRKALRKYQGTLPKNLEKHNLRLWFGQLRGEGPGCKSESYFYGSDCDLCQKYADDYCHGCPLNDHGLRCSDSNSAWRHFRQHNNPEKIITLILAAIEKLEREAQAPQKENDHESE